jgi:hypothetical protein
MEKFPNLNIKIFDNNGTGPVIKFENTHNTWDKIC